jgi:ketosteroid isomerase-like protein
MGPENIERIQRAYEGMVAGDTDVIIDFAHPEVEWHNPAYAIEPGIRRGREQFLEVVRGLRDTFENVEMAIEEIIGTDERAVVIVRFRGEGRAAGVPIDQTFGHLLDFRDGLVVRFEWFLDPDAAIRALEEPD